MNLSGSKSAILSRQDTKGATMETDIHEVGHEDRERVLGKLSLAWRISSGICPGPTTCPMPNIDKHQGGCACTPGSTLSKGGDEQEEYQDSGNTAGQPKQSGLQI